MTFDAPVPFRTALDYLRSRSVLPTNMSAVELRQLGSDLLRRSFFSARTTSAEYAQYAKSTVEGLLEGEFNIATARAKLQDLLDALDYNPERGFPGDKGIPPAEPGTLRDLSSNERTKLVLETNMRQAANFGFWRQGQDDLARYQFPALELVRIYPRRKERDDWPERWVRAGGKLSGDRMVAAKDDEVWNELGSSDLFDDGLDNPYPPFAFNSGMGFREVDRDEAIAMGVIDPDETPEFFDKGLNDELKQNAAQFEPEFLSLLEKELDAKIKDGELTAS